MFRLTDPPGPSFNPGWQKVVDVRSGAVEDVPATDVPSQPNLNTEPMVSPDGRKITMTSDDGRVEVVLHDATGPRTLLSVRGPAEVYRMSSAFWAPNWQYIAADDGRLLIITTGDPAVTRVLTAESTQGGYGGYPRFAVTDANVLTSGT
jgi:Tol biopolymer transport system component